MQPEAGSEDMIESKPKSGHGTEMRRRLALLAPVSMGRKLVAGIVAVALVLGLVAGFLVGSVYGPEQTATLGIDAVPGPDAGYIPIVPGDSVLAQEDGVIVFTTVSEFLTTDDLQDAGETPASAGAMSVDFTSGLDGLCGNEPSPGREPVPAPRVNPIATTSYRLSGATLTEHIGPDLGVLAASTLRGTVELVGSCGNGDGLTVQTDGIEAGIGDEYATFTVSRLNPGSGLGETSIVVLVRVGERLLEIALSPDGAVAVPDGLARALRIAEVAVSRMLAG
ncbi:MAG: hypothetical protein ACR2J5_11280 [Geodermatophilaceae bacterium]